MDERHAKREVAKFLRARGFTAECEPRQRDFDAAAKALNVDASTASQLWATRMKLDGPRPSADDAKESSSGGHQDFLAVLYGAEWCIRICVPMLPADVATALSRASIRGLAVQCLLTNRPQSPSEFEMLKNLLHHDVGLSVSKKERPAKAYVVIDRKLVVKIGDCPKRGLTLYERGQQGSVSLGTVHYLSLEGKIAFIQLPFRDRCRVQFMVNVVVKVGKFSSSVGTL